MCRVMGAEIGVVVDPPGHVRDLGGNTRRGEIIGRHLVPDPVEGLVPLQLPEMLGGQRQQRTLRQVPAGRSGRVGGQENEESETHGGAPLRG